METQNAIKLIRELKANKFLPKFNDQGILDVCNEIRGEFDKINETLTDENFDREDKTQTSKILVTNQHMQRNLRCGLAYVNARLDRLHRLAWESGKSLPEHIKEKLSPPEITYYHAYIEAIDDYNKSIGGAAFAMDLTVDMQPPKELFIEVRVKVDYGSVVLPESGEVNLAKGTTHLLRRTEVDHLIKKGIVDEVI